MTLVSRLRTAAPVTNTSFQCHYDSTGKDDNNSDIQHDGSRSSPCRCFRPGPYVKRDEGNEDPQEVLQIGRGGDGGGPSLFLFLRQCWEKAVDGLRFKQENKNEGVHDTTTTTGGNRKYNQESSTTTTQIQQQQQQSKKKDFWFNKLWNFHCQSDRFYHTPVHLEEMIYYLHLVLDARSDELPQQANDDNDNNEAAVAAAAHEVLAHVSQSDDNEMEQVLLLSIFFHDAVYNVHSSTNEIDSAQLFQDFVQDLATVHETMTQRVEAYILATQHHSVSSQNPVPLALFLDLDMAVLGKESSAYLAYASLIRKEYTYIPHDVYCEKRCQVLSNFLEQQSSIYGTMLFRLALEEQARSNLALEITMLRQGHIPGE